MNINIAIRLMDGYIFFILTFHETYSIKSLYKIKYAFKHIIYN